VNNIQEQHAMFYSARWIEALLNFKGNDPLYMKDVTMTSIELKHAQLQI